VNVIRHDNIAADQPTIRFAPRINEKRHNFRPGKQRSALFYANRYELNDRLVGKLQWSKVRQSVSSKVTIWVFHLSLGLV
jgi:hypothetical protein